MEARHALSFQRSGAGRLSNHGAPGGLSSSLPVLSNPQLPDYQEAAVGRSLKSNPTDVRQSLPSNSGAVGHIFSSSAGFSSDLQYSTSASHGKHSRKTPFISQSSNHGETMPLHNSCDSGVFKSTASSRYTTESNNDSWCTDSVRSYLDCPVTSPGVNNQIDDKNGVCVGPSEDFNKTSDWQEWAEHLITDDNALPPNWVDLLVDDTAVAGPEPQVVYSDKKFFTFFRQTCFCLFSFIRRILKHIWYIIIADFISNIHYTYELPSAATTGRSAAATSTSAAPTSRPAAPS